MTKMMNDMTIKPTGNIDRDFVTMMVPHQPITGHNLIEPREPSLVRVTAITVFSQEYA